MINKVVDIALGEVGYLEKKSNFNLDSKTSNAGSGNWTKYARDLDGIRDFYNGKKNGYSWCDVFVDWCFVQAFGEAKARELLCQPTKSAGAGTTASAGYYKAKGQFFKSPKVGDQIFFGNDSGCTHTGLVYMVDNAMVYTVEGNTSVASGVVANGGGVWKKSYALTYSKIYGYGRPNYYGTAKAVEPVEDMDINNVKQVQVWLNRTFHSGLVVDGLYGTNTKKALVKALQQTLGVEADGIYGAKTNAAIKTLKKGSTGTLVRILQCFLICRKQNITADGIYGDDTALAVRIIQKLYKIDNDGIAGKMTFRALCS